jgi:hypothetical protein
MARTYKRDSRGRFASGGGGSSGGRPKARMATRGTNRLTRDNAGKITGTGDGATARGGRLKTAAGNQRGKVMARIGGGGGKLRGGKGKAAAKAYGRGVDAAKVERMLGRLQKSPSYQGKTKRLMSAKQSAGAKTRQRATDFLSKQAGLQSDGTSMGRKRWKAPEGMTQQQMKQNIAGNLPKQTKRSTARTGSKKLVTRAQKRDQKIQERLNPPRASYAFGRNEPKPSGPKRLSQRYDGGTARGSRSLAGATARQRGRRRAVEALAGTGRLMRPAARLQRGRAGQGSLLGGRTTTYGRIRRRS